MNTYSPVVFQQGGISAYIGQLSVEFVKLEESIDQNLWKMFRLFLKLDEQTSTDFGSVITPELDFSQKLSLMLVMTSRIFGENSNKVAKIRSFSKRARFLRDKKEQLLHSPWGTGEDGCLYVAKRPGAPRTNGNGDRWQKICEEDMNLFLREIQKLFSAMVLSGMLLDNMNGSDSSPNLKEEKKVQAEGPSLVKIVSSPASSRKGSLHVSRDRLFGESNL